MSFFRLCLSSPSPRRLYSTSLHPAHLNLEALDRWIATDKTLTLQDTLTVEHLSDLYVTLPTRDGRDKDNPYRAPRAGTPLPYGHHLAFFHPRNPETVLRQDGTDADFCPPEPFTRRMWAGGKMKWNYPLVIGDKVTATSAISSVQKKGFDYPSSAFSSGSEPPESVPAPSPMVLVKQRMTYAKHGDGGDKPKEIAIEEERSHVYLSSPGNVRRVRQVPGLPAPDFSFTYTPTPTTLFRFSALTFNGHYIHLDKAYANFEGYPERLVHGPLTALMLLEATVFHHPDAVVQSFEYRAVNPLVVGQPIGIWGAWENKRTVIVWATGGPKGNDVVGMTGKIHL